MLCADQQRRQPGGPASQRLRRPARSCAAYVVDRCRRHGGSIVDGHEAALALRLRAVRARGSTGRGCRRSRARSTTPRRPRCRGAERILACSVRAEGLPPAKHERAPSSDLAPPGGQATACRLGARRRRRRRCTSRHAARRTRRPNTRVACRFDTSTAGPKISAQPTAARCPASADTTPGRLRSSNRPRVMPLQLAATSMRASAEPCATSRPVRAFARQPRRQLG